MASWEKVCRERWKGCSEMKAGTRTVGRFKAGLRVVSSDTVRGELRPGWWVRLRRALGRMGLLLVSPIVSFRWARAKRKAISRKNAIQVSKSPNQGNNGTDGKDAS